MSGDRYMESDFYSDSAYTQDISNKMRVPDKLMAHNGHSDEESWGKEDRQHSFYNMQVPDRILVAGRDQHLSSKSTPRELQLEPHFVPPTPEHVRVQTPPRSIKLESVLFPSVHDAPFCPTPQQGYAPSPPYYGQEDSALYGGYTRANSSWSIKLDEVSFPSASEVPTSQGSPPAGTPSLATRNKLNTKERVVSFDNDVSLSERSESNLSLYDEVQMMRRQMAKLNHRLMGVELENHQHNQRWQFASVLVSAYFLVKTFIWMNRN